MFKEGGTTNLICVNMGFLKWHGGSNERRKKGCPDRSSILRERTVIQEVFMFFISYAIILKSDTENVQMHVYICLKFFF